MNLPSLPLPSRLMNHWAEKEVETLAPDEDSEYYENFKGSFYYVAWKLSS